MPRSGPADEEPPSGSLLADYRTLRESVGLLEFLDRGVLHLAGPEGPSFLQGLVTGDLLGLPSGRGRDTVFLSPTGKVLGRAAVFRAGPEALYLLLHTAAAPVAELLDRYHFGERVEISDLSRELVWLSLHGPAAPAAAEEVCGPPSAPQPWELRTERFGERSVRVLRMDEVGVPAWHFLAPRGGDVALREALEDAARRWGGGPVSREAWEVCRVESGLAWMGAELDESVLPMEAGLQPLLDPTKGCYVGQEVVARAQVQGRTNWSLWGVRLPDDARLTPGRELRGTGRPRPVLRLRSVIRSPETGERIALGYVHREAAAPGPLRVVDEAAGELEVRLEPLPFAAAARAHRPHRTPAPSGARPVPRDTTPDAATA